MTASTAWLSSASISGTASAESVVSPTTGFAAARPMPRAAATPTRRPVKLPGPTVTATRSRSANSVRASLITLATSGISASAWPRAIGSDRLRARALSSVSRTATEQASSAVSMARTRIGGNGLTAPGSAPTLADSQPVRQSRPEGYMGRTSTTSGTKCRSRFWMPCLSVAGGAPPRLDQLLDGGDGVGVLRLEELVRRGRAGAIREHRRAGHEVLHDGAEDRRLDVLPLAVRLGHGDEVAAEKHAGHAGQREQPLGERRLRRLRRIGDVEHALAQHRPSRQELEGRRIGGRLGLDEHRRLLGGFKARGPSGIALFLNGIFEARRQHRAYPSPTSGRAGWVLSSLLAALAETTHSVIPGRALARTRNPGPTARPCLDSGFPALAAPRNDGDAVVIAFTLWQAGTLHVGDSPMFSATTNMNQARRPAASADDDRATAGVVYGYTWSAAIWLLIGSAYGMIGAAALVWPDLLPYE